MSTCPSSISSILGTTLSVGVSGIVMLMETGEVHVELSSDGDGVKAIEELPDGGAAHGLLNEGPGEG